MRYFIFTATLLIGGIFMIPAEVQALTISPVKLELAGDPGQVIQGDITLFNEENTTETLYSSFSNFEARGESGTPFFLPEKVGLATWFKTQDEIVLKPKQEKTVPFTIRIPKDAEPGGHFAAILWGTTPVKSSQGGQVAVGGRLGVLVFLKVSGEVKEGGGLLDFASKDSQKVFTSLPISFTYRFNNSGGDRVVPEGEIKITNLFGFTATVLPANKNAGSVLPGSARKFETVWVPETISSEDLTNTGFWTTVKSEWNDFHFGWYTAKMTFLWGATKQSATMTYGFFILPWQLLLVILLLLVVVVLLGTWLLRKYNRWIIAQAMKR